MNKRIGPILKLLCETVGIPLLLGLISDFRGRKAEKKLAEALRKKQREMLEEHQRVSALVHQHCRKNHLALAYLAAAWEYRPRPATSASQEAETTATTQDNLPTLPASVRNLAASVSQKRTEMMNKLKAARTVSKALSIKLEELNEAFLYLEQAERIAVEAAGK